MENIDIIFKKQFNKTILNKIPLFGGTSNDIILVNNEYVIRLPKGYNDPFNSYKIEFEILDDLFTKDVTEKIYYYDKNIGIKISSYIKNSQQFSCPNKDYIYNEIIRKIKILHKTTINTRSSFLLFKRLKYYKSFANEYIDESYEKNIISDVKSFIYKTKFVVSHNDLVSGNILISNNSVKLIDFEFANYNHHFFDLASLISENNIGKTEANKLMKKYLGLKYTRQNIYQINKLINIQNILWYYWAQMRYQQTKDNVFLEIKNIKKAMIISNIHSNFDK